MARNGSERGIQGRREPIVEPVDRLVDDIEPARLEHRIDTRRSVLEMRLVKQILDDLLLRLHGEHAKNLQCRGFKVGCGSGEKQQNIP